jgi:hypothetical protein
MTRGDYNDYRGWAIPAGEKASDEGYLIEYLDGGEGNHPAHHGYISWTPKDVFDKAYQPAVGLSFGMALDALKQDMRVARTGWNGKGMWLELCQLQVRLRSTNVHESFEAAPWIGLKTVDDKVVPWTPSQTDLLANDWITV